MRLDPENAFEDRENNGGTGTMADREPDSYEDDGFLIPSNFSPAEVFELRFGLRV